MKPILKTMKVYDRALCCSTGVCGTEVDPVLIRFASDLQWFQSKGILVRRYSLTQTPSAYLEHGEVKKALEEQGETALPMILIDDETVCSGKYPTRKELEVALGIVDSEWGEEVVDETSCRGGGCC